ncbi:MAG: FtsX-like permease family protein, partial [Planctomycetota bacterium]|nr:FtsX-like permease family protein [Planctomycetota bacterium]
HKINFIPIQAGGQSVILIQKTFDLEAPIMIDLEGGETERVQNALAEGEVVIGTTLGQRTGLGVGDDITLQTRIGPRDVRIAAFATEYTAGGMVIYMDRARSRQLFSTQGVHVYAIAAREGRADHVTGPLRAVCNRHGCMLESRADFRKMIDDSMSGVVGAEWMLMALGFIVASLGIVNTLTMNVLEQTREIGLLRAIAMKRGQVRNMVFTQALLIGVMSLPPGVVGGLTFAYLLHVSNYPLIGVRYDFSLQWPLLCGCLAAALIITVMAAMFPARRAGGLSVIEALQYE